VSAFELASVTVNFAKIKPQDRFRKIKQSVHCFLTLYHPINLQYHSRLKHTIGRNSLSSPVVCKLIREPGIKPLDFKPFNPVDKHTKITYCEDATGKLECVTKGMTGMIVELFIAPLS